jgi:hypothetical protein
MKMAKRNRNRNNRPQQQQPQVNPEQPKQEEPMTFNVKIEYVGGGEPTVLQGLLQDHANLVINWYKGNSHNVIDIPVGTSLLMIDRANVANILVTKED